MFNTVEEAKRYIEAKWTKWDVPTNPIVRRQLAVGLAVATATESELLLVGGHETAGLVRALDEGSKFAVHDLPVCACGNRWTQTIECTCDIDTLREYANKIGRYLATHNVGMVVCYTVDDEDMMEWLAAQPEYQRFEAPARDMMREGVQSGMVAPYRLKAVLDICDVMAGGGTVTAPVVAEAVQYEISVNEIRHTDVID